jgi:hypothetical protein
MLYDLCFLADEEKTRTHLRRTDRQLFPQKQSIFKIHHPAQSIYKRGSSLLRDANTRHANAETQVHSTFQSLYKGAIVTAEHTSPANMLPHHIILDQ